MLLQSADSLFVNEPTAVCVDDGDVADDGGGDEVNAVNWIKGC